MITRSSILCLLISCGTYSFSFSFSRRNENQVVAFLQKPNNHGLSLPRRWTRQIIIDKRNDGKQQPIFSSTDSAADSNTDGDDDSLYEAEEAAAVDAHDVSDPGMEGAAMERAVIMAQDFKEEHLHHIEEQNAEKKTNEKKKKEEVKKSSSVIGKIKSLFQIPFHEDDDEDILEAEDAAAFDAHDLSDPGMEAAAMERAVMMAEEMKESHLHHHHSHSHHQSKHEQNAVKADADRRDSNDANSEKSRKGSSGYGGDHVKSVKEHYDSMERDVSEIERLISRAAEADKSEHHTLERTFSDQDAVDLALLMMEKSIAAAADRVQLCREEAERTEDEVKMALEEKYAAKALSESIERERHEAEMRFLSTEHFEEDFDVMERLRDSSVIHADENLLEEALKEERHAESKLEEAIEKDIKAKQELEQMIDNKAALKEELHELEKIIHERAVLVWEKEKGRKSGQRKN